MSGLVDEWIVDDGIAALLRLPRIANRVIHGQSINPPSFNPTIRRAERPACRTRAVRLLRLGDLQCVLRRAENGPFRLDFPHKFPQPYARC